MHNVHAPPAPASPAKILAPAHTALFPHVCKLRNIYKKIYTSSHEYP